MKNICALISLIIAFSAIAQLPEPYAYWKMDAITSEGKVVDATGGGADMMLGKGVSLVDDYMFGKVLRWEGTASSWAWFQNKALKSRTISMWFKQDALDADLDTPNNNKIPYVFYSFSAMNLNFSKNTSGYNLSLAGKDFYNVTIPTRSQWHQLTIVFEDEGYFDDAQTNSVGKMWVYLDGKLSRNYEDVITVRSVESASKTILGNHVIDDNHSDPRPYKGLFSRIRVYDVALGEDDIFNLYYDDKEAFNRAPLGYWKLNETYEDESGKKYFVPHGGESIVDLVCAKNVKIVSDSDAGCNVAEFPNYAQESYASFKLPEHSRNFSFGVWMNVPTNLLLAAQCGALDNESLTNTMPNVYYFCAYSRLCIEGGYRNVNSVGGHFFDAKTLDNSNAQGFNCSDIYDSNEAKRGVITVQKGRWGHFGMTFEITQETDGYAVTPRIYVDGLCVRTGIVQTVSTEKLKGYFEQNTSFYLGTGSTASPRSFLGRMSDFTVYQRLLSQEEMAELARGMPSVDAGDDITLAVGVQGRLNGKVANCGKFGNRKSAPAKLVWSLISAPEGGEGAEIRMKDSAVCAVVLPAIGEYVFRLTAQSETLRIFEYDEVKVTCVDANSDNVAPTVTITGPESVGLLESEEFEASAFDSDSAPGTLSLRWKVVSGPGAASFNPVFGLKTDARFYAAGKYKIAAVAFDGQSETTSAPIEVLVSAGENVNLESGLIAYWPFDVTLKEKITGAVYSEIDRLNTTFEKSVDGYGVRCRSAFYPYVNTQMTLQETTSDSSYSVPDERYRAFSAWIYHDPADTNNSKCATIVSVPYTLGLWYNCENGVNGFSMYQQVLGGTAAGNGNIDEYAMPSVNPEGKWTHVYALFDRTTGYQSNTSELWIDGVKMTNRTKHGMGGGRVREAENIMIGGHKKNGDGANGHFKDENGNYYSRSFPGIIDEVRMYNRKLSAAEIKFLAANPVVDVNHAPVASLAKDTASAISRRQLALVAHIGDDNDAISSLSGHWEVIAGDENAVAFGDATSAETTFTAKKKGTYTLAYVVSDGVHTTYSEPMEIVVERAGMVMKIK